MVSLGRRLVQDKAKYLAILVFCLVILFLIIAYVVLDTLNVYDAAGHVLAVYKAKSFWPDWHGWSSDMLGWSQGSTYPPGVHWIMAGLANLIGVTASVKLVVVGAIILLPIAIWRYLRSIDYRGVGGFIVLVFIFVVLVAAPDYFGSSIKSLFNLGLITNFVALPVLFFFLLSIERLNKLNSLFNIILSGSLLAMLVWMHLVVAAVGVLYFSILILEKIIKSDFKVVLSTLKIIFIAVLLCSPFIYRIVVIARDQSTSGVGITSLLLPNLIAFVIALIFSYKALKSGKTIIARLCMMSVIFALICFLDALLVLIFGNSFIIGKLHVYRFQIFAYLFFVIATSDIIVKNLNNYSIKYRPVLRFALLGVLVVVVLINNPYKFGYVNISVDREISVSGRFLEVFSRSQSYPAPYAFQSTLARSNIDTAWGLGLFIESAPNSPFVKSLSKSMSPTVNDKVLQTNLAIDETILPIERQKQALNLFAIENTVALDDVSDLNSGIWSRFDSKKYYHINNLGTQKIAEAPNLKLIPVKSNWNTTIAKWWQGQGPMLTLPYDAAEQEIQATDYNTDTKINIDEFTEKTISLYINSDKVVPVLIKITYSSEWAAYSNGNKLRIWKAAPCLILIEASGHVTLENS